MLQDESSYEDQKTMCSQWMNIIQDLIYTLFVIATEMKKHIPCSLRT